VSDARCEWCENDLGERRRVSISDTAVRGWMLDTSALPLNL